MKTKRMVNGVQVNVAKLWISVGGIRARAESADYGDRLIRSTNNYITKPASIVVDSKTFDSKILAKLYIEGDLTRPAGRNNPRRRVIVESEYADGTTDSDLLDVARIIPSRIGGGEARDTRIVLTCEVTQVYYGKKRRTLNACEFTENDSE
jgi:hypothetical protein